MTTAVRGRGGSGLGGGAGSSSAAVLMTGMSSALERMIRNPNNPPFFSVLGFSGASFALGATFFSSGSSSLGAGGGGSGGLGFGPVSVGPKGL